MDFEKFVQLIMQATGTISSLQCITANLVSFITVMIFRKHITYLYGTLNGMDNSIINVATWGLLFSVYIMIYKAVSAVFIKYNNVKKGKRLKQDIMTLSNNEIAILRFILTQDSQAAWLPDKMLPVIQLETKNIIHNIDYTRTKIASIWRDFTYGVSCSVYTISNDAQNIISQLPPDIRKKWRKVKPDRTLKDYQ
ncbi:MAG: super-infection exclusion protein B [Synergistaceae bacterium]|nr:super-infection exclusion protein B [Synergistaceae bacterium]